VTVEELSRNQCHPKVIGLLDANLQEAVRCGLRAEPSVGNTDYRQPLRCLLALFLADVAKTE
jgi:hypothetical protein